jgi:hypothetical protein
VVTAAVVAEKVALVWPAETVTLAGTVKAAALLISVTVLATRAALFKVTVQVLDALLLSVEGEQDKEEICAGAVPLSVKVLETPPRDAVTTAV